jgi:hypothetical protein
MFLRDHLDRLLKLCGWAEVNDFGVREDLRRVTWTHVVGLPVRVTSMSPWEMWSSLPFTTYPQCGH